MHIIFNYEKEMKFRLLAGPNESATLLFYNSYFDSFLIE